MAEGTLSEAAPDFFYHSRVREMLRDGISDLHCMSDTYIAQDLWEEYQSRRIDLQ